MTLTIIITPATPVTAVSVTGILRSDTGLTPAGISLPIALASSGASWTGTFTDTAPPPYYTATATLTANGIVSQPFNFPFNGVSATPSAAIAKRSVTTPPTDTPVSLAQVKAQLRIETTNDDSYLPLLIAAATDYAQDQLGMSLMPQTITAVFNAEDIDLSPPVKQYPADPFSPLGSPLASPLTTWGTYGRSAVIPLLRGPVRSIASVTNANGTAVTQFNLERTPAGDRLRLRATLNYPITVVYVAGYAQASDIPAGIAMAILAHVGTLYKFRESVSDKSVLAVPHSLENFYRLKSRRIPGG